jgi:outer membrane murein-binding lipoprotein Lpp
VRDPGTAEELLAEAADALDNPDDRELAAIVRQFLDAQIVSNRKINDLNKQVADQSKRIAELEQQQRALMSIEKNIQQRDNPAGAGNDN